MTKIKRYKLNNTASGDGTNAYKIVLEKECTVKEFIATILSSYPDEWGYIGIENKIEPFLGKPKIEYSKGKLIGTIAELELMPLDSKIITVRARGGWTSMDYVLKIQK